MIVKAKGQVKADRRFSSGIVQHVHPAMSRPTSRRPSDESNRRCVPQSTTSVPITHQLLHNWLVPGM